MDNKYNKLTDKELISIILSGREDAFLYLLYVRYRADVLYHVTSFDHTDYYYEDIISLVYKSLKGKNGDWLPLSNFQWKCKFRTWLNKIIYSECCAFFRKKIDTTDISPSIVVEDKEELLEELVLMEAIARLDDEDGRFILLRVLEGYSSKEIAILLERKRREEGRIKHKPDGKELIPSDGYVDNYKRKCLSKIKEIMISIKEELI